MASVADVCQTIVENVQDGLACAVVDCDTGMLMGIYHVVPHFTPEYLDTIAAAAVEMFCGRTVKRVEELLSIQRGTPVKNSFEEIFISSQSVYHFMTFIRAKNVITILVTRKSASQGLGWAALRNSAANIIAVLP